MLLVLHNKEELNMKKAKIRVLYADLGDYSIINTIYINKDWFDNHKWLEPKFNLLKDLIVKNHFGYNIKDKMLDLINNVIYWQNDKKFTDFTIEYVKMN
jgi:hypothetical protein